LEAEVERLQKYAAEVEPLFVEGAKPVECLVRYIRKEEPSLVVVGCDVKGPVDRWALGSFSEAVAEDRTEKSLRLQNVA
jgi:nucleotide-binding universal stress UspA family protein